MKIGIIGAGPAGVMASIQILQNINCEVIFFEDKPPLATLLPTGGGRCNLAYAEFDNNELVKFYPRGEKFLYSVFSIFSSGDTVNFFEQIGVQTYTQEDMRVFPTENSSEFVRQKLLNQIKRAKFIKEKVFDIKKTDDFFLINKNYKVDRVIFAGGIKNNVELLKAMDVNVVETSPALCALCVAEKSLYSLTGVSLKNVQATCNAIKNICGDLLFTHNSISGPLAYKVSSYCAYEKIPYIVQFNFINKNADEFNDELIKLLSINSKKDIVNILTKFIPRSFSEYVLNVLNIPKDTKASQVSKQIREKIINLLTDYKINVIAHKKDCEIVTAGGVNLDFINSKTMEYKLIPGLYFCGEVINVDGLTGGFNLQNCWSTGYIAGCAASKT